MMVMIIYNWEDESFLQETRNSDEAALLLEAQWRSYLQTRGSRLMVTQANSPENQVKGRRIPILPVIKELN